MPESPKKRGLEWYLNPVAFGFLNPNVGLRMDTRSRWKMDLSLASQLPAARVYGIEDWTVGYGHAFVSTLGWGMQAYFGWTKMKKGWAEPGPRFTLQMGFKAFHTGDYYWERVGGEGSQCGIVDQIRVNVGPRFLFSDYIVVSSHFGLEIFGGCGFRIGMRKYKWSLRGQLEPNCTVSTGFEPSQGFDQREPSLVPTLHFGMRLVFR